MAYVVRSIVVYTVSLRSLLSFVFNLSIPPSLLLPVASIECHFSFALFERLFVFQSTDDCHVSKANDCNDILDLLDITTTILVPIRRVDYAQYIRTEYTHTHIHSHTLARKHMVFCLKTFLTNIIIIVVPCGCCARGVLVVVPFERTDDTGHANPTCKRRF